MAKEKSILDKFTETMRSLADSAAQALKSEQPARVDETAAAYIPFAAEGFVSDPLPVAPFAARPPRRRRSAARKTAKRGASKAAANTTTTKAAKKSTAKKPARKSTDKSASARSKQAAKTANRRGRPKKAVRSRGS